jgi:hypothetical protein
MPLLVPSAPPFVGSEPDFKETAEQISAFKAHGTPSLSNSSGSATKNEYKSQEVQLVMEFLTNQLGSSVCFIHLFILFSCLFSRSC